MNEYDLNQINNDYKLLMEEIDINTEYNSVDIIDELLDHKRELLYSKFIDTPINIQYKIIMFLINENSDIDSFITFITKIYNNHISINILILLLDNFYVFDCDFIMSKYSKKLTFKDYQKLLYHNIYFYNFINIKNIELRKQVKELYEFLTI